MEVRDLYDKNKNVTGLTFKKGEKVPEGYYYLLVGLLIENDKGEFLLQRRSPDKGGKWAGTGGHAKAGQTSLEAVIDETKEELGIDISKENIINFENVKEGNVFCDFYYVKANIDLKDIVIQEEELSEVGYFSREEINKLIEKNDFDKDYNDMYDCFLKYEEGLSD